MDPTTRITGKSQSLAVPRPLWAFDDLAIETYSSKNRIPTSLSSPPRRAQQQRDLYRAVSEQMRSPRAYLKHHRNNSG